MLVSYPNISTIRKLEHIIHIALLPLPSHCSLTLPTLSLLLHMCACMQACVHIYVNLFQMLILLPGFEPLQTFRLALT